MKKYSKKTIIRTDLINKSGECPIAIRYIYDRKTFLYPIGLTIKPDAWDENEDCPIPSKATNFKVIYKLITTKEDEVEEKIQEFFNQYGQYPTTSELKKLLTQSTIINPKVKGKDAVSVLFKEFIEVSKREDRIGINTHKVFKSCYLHYLNFENSVKNNFCVEDINKDLMIQFQAYLWRLNLQNSTINKYLKFFKSFISNYLIDRKNYQINSSYTTLKSTSKDRKEKIDVLSEDEVERLKQLVFWEELSDEGGGQLSEVILTEREKQIGRMFLFQCYTGVSFSDLLQISFFNVHFPKLSKVKKIQEIYDNRDNEPSDGEKIREGCVIAFERQKTNVPCLIPLFGTTIDLVISQYFKLFGSDIGAWELFRLMDNENERIQMLKSFLVKLKRQVDANKLKRSELFPKISNQNYNREIKELFKKINLNDMHKIKLNNSKATTLIKSKWQLISSHSGRRTYISLNINKGLGIDTIMRTTGHNNFETLRIYVKQSQQSVYEEFEKVVNN